MTCDEVREQLAEHLLGTLDDVTDVRVRSHLRSCGACRREMTTLAEGLDTFSRAAHEVEPPAPLHDRVLGALAEEWAEAPADASPRRRRPVRVVVASGIAAAAVVASLAWGVSEARVASHYEANAGKYQAFLHVLGGKNVRFGRIQAAGAQQIDGSVVLYDSDVEQSWALILVRAPGMSGQASVTLSSSTGRTIEMHPLEFAEGGESSSWLVTSSDLRRFDRVVIRDASGAVVATARVAA